MGGGDETAAVRHSTLMAEFEEKFQRDSPGVDTGRHKRRRLEISDVGPKASPGSVGNPLEIESDEDSSQEDERANAPGSSWWHDVPDLKDVSPGDQVYSYRGPIQHHGIVVRVPAESLASELTTEELSLAIKVVHFDPSTDGIETTTLAYFLQGAALRKAYYSASVLSSALDCGASYACEADDPQVVVRRATEAAKFGNGISGWSGYSLLTNNCETFACWCSTGRRSTLSRQATRGLVGAGVLAAGVSCAAAASSLSSSAGVLGVAAAPRRLRRAHRIFKELKWAVGAAATCVALADGISLWASRKPDPSTARARA